MWNQHGVRYSWELSGICGKWDWFLSSDLWVEQLNVPRLHFCHNFVLRVDADQAVDLERNQESTISRLHQLQSFINQIKFTMKLKNPKLKFSKILHCSSSTARCRSLRKSSTTANESKYWVEIIAWLRVALIQTNGTHDVVVDEQPQAVTSHEQAQEEHDDHPWEEEAPVLLPHALDEQSRADDEHQEVENHESPGWLGCCVEE